MPHIGRCARARLRAAGKDDSGFILPYVLLITMLIMIGTATALGAVANSAVPAQRSQAQEAALAAAQAGIQAYVAQLNSQCANFYAVTSTYSIQECSWPETTTKGNPLRSGSSAAAALSTGTYSVYATNSTGFLSANQDDLRISSTGTSGGASTTLLADVAGVPNALRFAYFTDYESFDPRFLAGYYPARSITVPGSTALSLLGLTAGTTATVTWPGLTTSTAATCGALWYTSPTNTTANNVGRSALGDAVSENGTLTPAATGITPSISHVCSVAFTNGTAFNGPVYTHDALYVSNGLPANSTGPSFSVPTPCTTTKTSGCEPLPPASSPWSSANSPAAPGCTLATCASPAVTAPYRSVAVSGGTPTTSNSGLQAVQTSYFNVTLPSTTTQAAQTMASAAALATCSYPGNVTIAVAGSTATVSGTGAAGQSAACTSVAVSKTTLYVSGTATVAAGGSLSAGKLSIAATADIVLNGSLSTTATTTTNQFNENAVTGTNPAIDLVAQNNVRFAHVISGCADGSAPSASTGYCTNDISGLYTTAQSGEVVNANGTLKSTHPARQYCNATVNSYPCTGGNQATCDAGSGTTGVTVNAAIFALTGSLQTDNYNRGCALGTATVNGGVYTNFRGPVGQEWEVPSSGGTTRSYSGYKLQVNYVSLETAGLPFVPPLQGGTQYHPWQLISVSS